MARWDDLTGQTMEVLENAQGFLEVRKIRTMQPDQQARLENWSQTLDQQLGEIKTIAFTYKQKPVAAVVAPREQPIYVGLSKQLELRQKDLRELHLGLDFDDVDRIMNNVDIFVGNFLAARPHGSGWGPEGDKGDSEGQKAAGGVEGEGEIGEPEDEAEAGPHGPGGGPDE